MEAIIYIMKTYLQKKVVDMINDLCSLDADEYRDTFRNPGRDFTRERKQPLGTVVKTGLMNCGSCLSQQLRLAHGLGDRPTLSAYVQQRDKLTQPFFRRLFSRQLSYEGGHTLYKGKYLIIACDGSGINIHPDKDDMGTRIIHTKDPDGEKICNQVHLNALCTVPDGCFIDYEIQEFRNHDEIGACALMMRRIPSMDLDGVPVLCLDRGYESYHLMMLADSLGLRFCMRLKDIGSSGISSKYSACCDDDGCFDVISDKKYTYSSSIAKDMDNCRDYVVCSKSSRNPFIPEASNPVGRPRKGTPRQEPSYYRFSFRLVRFRLPGGGFEVLATNFDGNEASVKDLMRIYHFRWSIETAFRQLKYDDFAAFIHTRKKEAAIGEIVLSLIFHNICSLVIMIVSRKVLRRSRNRMISYSLSYSDLSSSMRLLISGRDPTASMKKIVRELEITLQPIRNGRAFFRQLNRHSFVPFIYRAA